MVAVSVASGVGVVSSADDRVLVLAASRDLASGTTVGVGDFVATPVRLEEGGKYIEELPADLGVLRLSRDVGAGELLPRTALAAQSGEARLVTIPVEPMHGPAGLQHGDRVDVYVSPRDGTSLSQGSTASRLVLAGALVSEADMDADSATGEMAVVLQVGREAVQAVVAASRSGVLDLIRVPVGAP